MNTLIVILIVAVVAVVAITIVVKSKKKKGGELMAQQPTMPEPASTVEQETPKMEDTELDNQQPQL